VIAHYLQRDAPVLGVVELGGRVIPAERGYRAAIARVAAIFVLDPALTIDVGTLRRLADAYRVPALRPHGIDAGDYREIITVTSTVAGEAAEWLRREGRS
jgi:hypothetical protein